MIGDHAPCLDDISSLLRSQDVTANLVYSFGQYLDIIPSRASKGQALRYVAQRWGIPLEHILVAGGSGADEDMMRGNTLAVVVENRHGEELSQLADLDRIYFAAGLTRSEFSRPSSTTTSLVPARFEQTRRKNEIRSPITRLISNWSEVYLQGGESDSRSTLNNWSLQNAKNPQSRIFRCRLGTRFLSATKANPKEMLPVVYKPLIQYAAEEAENAGIDQLVFVTGRNKRSIEDRFDGVVGAEAVHWNRRNMLVLSDTDAAGRDKG